MSSSVDNAGLNLANLSGAERASIEQSKSECLERHKESKKRAMFLFSVLKQKPRIWIERELQSWPDIEKQTRENLNLLIRGNK